jgi:hypothetical protein
MEAAANSGNKGWIGWHGWWGHNGKAGDAFHKLANDLQAANLDLHGLPTNGTPTNSDPLADSNGLLPKLSNLSTTDKGANAGIQEIINDQSALQDAQNAKPPDLNKVNAATATLKNATYRLNTQITAQNALQDYSTAVSANPVDQVALDKALVTLNKLNS